ncbi:MAG: bacterioferritin, partial [Acidimicrobiales bacterium]|nr:bacterioferritin [Acidimicrobiales bacterium]
YFIHAKMRENWGFKRLAEVARKESIEEMEDADKIIERILYLDGVPNLQRYNPVLVGETVPEQLQLELETEKAAIDRYNRSIALAVAKGDNGSRELMEHRLVDEEAHADWLEAQLHLIDTIGVENYLAQQIND